MAESIFPTNQKNSILIVDDEPLNVTQLVRILGSDYTLFIEKRGRDAVSTAAAQKPDLILLDIIMPDMDGYAVIEALKENEDTCEIPVIFITGLGNQENEEKGLKLGAADYIIKPFSPAIVDMRVRNQLQVINSMRTIHRLSVIDTLTEMTNRRHFNERLQQEWHRAMRAATPLGFFMLDIDNFKKINDNYGHAEGDTVLKAVAKTIMSALKRAADIASRWGGEEFAVIVPDTDMEGTRVVAESIRASIASSEILIAENTLISVTASIGVNSLVPTSDSSLDHFVSAADKAMYCAKRTGKNCVHLAEEM
ncbi:MAG: diguanylate cyclase [Oscillospiraceae bacterium]|nr:diguanylate cyclase [Oscillospiraceae bacterium]